MIDDDAKEAERELANWGRHVYDGWLRDHLLYAVPPTSEGYVAPIVAHDDPEPPQAPVDHRLAELTERIVVHIGLEDFTSFQVLAHWYTRIQRAPQHSIEGNHDRALLRLAKKMHTSRDGAQRMLDEARYRYWLHRELQRLTTARKYRRIVGGS